MTGGTWTAEVYDVPDRPRLVRGGCSCGDTGPATTNTVTAGLWVQAHDDGHEVRRTKRGRE